MADEQWAHHVLEQLATEGLREQRRRRRWGIFFKLVGLAVVSFFLLGIFGSWGPTQRVCLDQCTALIELEGEIASTGRASADNMIAGLQAAFKNKGTKGVVLKVNSPGGSPVQAGQINDEIRRLRGKYPDTPLYVVVDEMCASGGYYVAVAADKIFVDKASLIGSIGVVIDGFGFVGAMDKVGVERRVLTAGENKAFLDPFSPVSPRQQEYAKQMLGEIHQQFIAAVRQGRGARLKESPEIFSGLVWNGARSIELGLADALGSVGYVAREVIKAEEIVDFTPQENIAERVARRFGATMARGVIAAVLERNWGR